MRSWRIALLERFWQAPHPPRYAAFTPSSSPSSHHSSAHPGENGVLFDLPHVIEAAHSAPASQEGLTLQAGDFFKDQLPTCDAYILMEVLHDWDERPALEIVS